MYPNTSVHTTLKEKRSEPGLTSHVNRRQPVMAFNELTENPPYTTPLLEKINPAAQSAQPSNYGKGLIRARRAWNQQSLREDRPCSRRKRKDTTLGTRPSPTHLDRVLRSLSDTAGLKRKEILQHLSMAGPLQPWLGSNETLPWCGIENNASPILKSTSAGPAMGRAAGGIFPQADSRHCSTAAQSSPTGEHHHCFAAAPPPEGHATMIQYLQHTQTQACIYGDPLDSLILNVTFSTLALGWTPIPYCPN